MGSNPVGPLAGLACFIAAAAAYALGWRFAAWLGAAGAAILTGALAARGLLAGYWPLTTTYEFALAFALTTVLATLLMRPETKSEVSGRALRHARDATGVPVAAMALAAALVAYARLGLPASGRAIRPLLPVLDSIWLPLHVGAAAMAYGALALAGAGGLVWLLRHSERPEANRVIDRAIAIGYPLLTLSMLLGMIWAQAAWGRYWDWDVKETWTLITWLIYTLYYHVRKRPNWRGRRLAWLAVAGLAAVLFTFLGVSWLARSLGLQSLHLF